MRSSTSLWLILLSAPLLSLQANAQAFKCKSATGETIFSSSPCAGTEKTVTVVQPEYIPPEEQARATERQAKRESQLQDIKARQAQTTASTSDNSASQAEAICREAVESMSQNPGLSDTEKIRLKQNCLNQSYCQQAATPTPGLIGGISADQRRTLLSCASDQGETYYGPTHIAPPPVHRPRPPYEHYPKPPKDPTPKPPAETTPSAPMAKPSGPSLPKSSIRLPGTRSD